MIKTCSDCLYYRANPMDLSEGLCHYNPPTTYPIVSAGGQVENVSLRPGVRVKDQACAHGQPKVTM